MSATEPVLLPGATSGLAAAFSPAVRAGGLLLVSGQVALDLETMQPIGDDVGAQARACFARISQILAAAGASLADVARVECYLTRREDFSRWHEVFAETFPTRPPARTTLFCELLVPGLLIEVQATAALVADASQ